jgi:hypothetical protein
MTVPPSNAQRKVRLHMPGNHTGGFIRNPSFDVCWMALCQPSLGDIVSATALPVNKSNNAERK